MMVTIRSSSSVVSSPALDNGIVRYEYLVKWEIESKPKGVNTPFVQVDIGLLAHQVGVAASDTLDLGQGVHDLLLTVDIGVEKTELEHRNSTISNLY